jgi:hypothetical protein
MKTKTISIILLLFGLVAGVYWIEAKREIEILCALIQIDQSYEKVSALLETGEHLQYVKTGNELRFSSIKNLHQISCEVKLSSFSTVDLVQYSERVNLTKIAAVIGTMLTVLLVIFQVLLSMGYPIGDYAWGGNHKILPKKLRIASGVSAVMLLPAIVSLPALEFSSSMPVTMSLYVVLTFTVLFLLSFIGNMASSNPKEKVIMIPASLALFLCYFLVGYSNL